MQSLHRLGLASVFLFAVQSLSAQTVEIPMKWRVGDKIVYDVKVVTVSIRRERHAQAQRTESESVVTISVLKEFEQGYVVDWSESTHAASKSSIRLAIDKNARIRKYLIADKWKVPSKAWMTQSLFEKPVLYRLPLKKKLAVGQTRSYAGPISTKFLDGEIPGSGKLSLVDVNAKTNIAKVGWKQEIDRNAIDQQPSLLRTAAKMSRTPEEFEAIRSEVEWIDAVSYEIDLRTGWIEKMVHNNLSIDSKMQDISTTTWTRRTSD